MQGESGSGIGVKGSATTGRGGVFSGGAAQLQLVPSTQAHPPISGQAGDLFLDSSARLWLCTAGGANAVWVTMGSGGGGGGGNNGGPIVAHSAVIATPGVYGDNTTNDPSSIGISGASVDGNGNPGAGTGVKGTSGTGSGVLGTSQGVGVWGQSSGSKNTGVYGIQTTNDGTGVAGRSYADGNQSALGAGVGVWGDTGTGTGVLGTANGGTGIKGTATGTGTGVWGQGGVGMRGVSNGSQLTGVYGVNTTNDGVGVAGRSYADGSQSTLGGGVGVWGDSGSGIGVKGSASTGRGGVFSGGAAQIQLQPASGNHPASGQDGDLFLDSAKQLWLCTAGGAAATWQQLGAGGGGGGNGGPLAGHSNVAGTPGVLGDNNSNDAASAGMSGKSLDGSGNPGNGFGVQGSSGNGAGVRGVSYLDATQTKLGYGDGVRGESAFGNGVYGRCDQGIGVRAETNGANVPALYARNGDLVSGTGIGLQALAEGIAVDAHTDNGIAVNGASTSGRGGVFSGGPAALQIKPGAVAPPTINQQVGDFYVDLSGNLWYWKGGPNWIQLA